MITLMEPGAISVRPHGNFSFSVLLLEPVPLIDNC